MKSPVLPGASARAAPSVPGKRCGEQEGLATDFQLPVFAAGVSAPSLEPAVPASTGLSVLPPGLASSPKRPHLQKGVTTALSWGRVQRIHTSSDRAGH